MDEAGVPGSRGDESVGFSDAELEEMEAEAIEEVAAVAQKHANRLPARSCRRPLLIRLANLGLALPPPDVPSPAEDGEVVSLDPKRRSSGSAR